jgi:sulfur-oxidizing protein SoxY
VGLTGAVLTATTGLLAPIVAWAGARNVEAFDAKAIDLALVAAGVADAVESEDVILRAPDIAENSAIVHVEIQSKVPDTRSILIFAEKNPQPLVAQFDLLPGLEPIVSVRIKMAESAHLRAVVLAGCAG